MYDRVAAFRVNSSRLSVGLVRLRHQQKRYNLGVFLKRYPQIPKGFPSLLQKRPYLEPLPTPRPKVVNSVLQ